MTNHWIKRYDTVLIELLERMYGPDKPERPEPVNPSPR